MLDCLRHADSKCVLILLVLHRSRRIVLQLSDLLVIMAEIVILYKL